MHISVLSLEDGKLDIVRAARKIATEVRAETLAVADISEGVVSRFLSTNRGMPDPDILIRIGQVDSNLGFLPWQSRLTEMHSIRNLRGVKFDEVYRVFMNFSKCEQRFGK